MSTFKRKGRDHWEYDFQRKGVRYTGKLEGAQNKTEADRLERAYIAQIEAGARPDAASEMSLEAACNRFYEEVGQHRKSWKDVQRSLELLCYCIPPKTKLKQIDGAVMIEAVKNRRLIPARNGSVPKNGTINRQIIEFAKGILIRAETVWGARSLQNIEWKKIRLPEPKAKKIEIPDEVHDAFDEMLSPDHWIPLKHFLATYGCRLSEAFFDPAECWCGNDGKVRIRLSERKEDDDHVITLLPEDGALMLARKSRAETAGLKTVWFREESGRLTELKPRGFQDAIKRARQKMGVAYSAHDFRHDAAAKVTREAGIHVARALLGHADITTTQRYAFVQDEDVTEAIQKAKSRQKSRQAEIGKAQGDDN